MTKFFTGMDIGEMNFYGRNFDARDGVAQGDAGVGIGGGVQNDGVEYPLGLLNPRNQFALHVRLSEVNFRSQLPGPFADGGLDVRQGGPAIDIRLALAEEIEIWPVEKKDFHLRF